MPSLDEEEADETKDGEAANAIAPDLDMSDENDDRLGLNKKS